MGYSRKLLKDPLGLHLRESRCRGETSNLLLDVTKRAGFHMLVYRPQLKIESVLSKCWTSCCFRTFSYIFEKVLRTLTGRKFLSTVRFSSPLSNGQTAAFFPSFGKREFRMLQLMALVKVFVSSLAARETSFGGILSSPVDFLPSKDLDSCSTSLLSTS